MIAINVAMIVMGMIIICMIIMPISVNIKSIIIPCMIVMILDISMTIIGATVIVMCITMTKQMYNYDSHVSYHDYYR